MNVMRNISTKAKVLLLVVVMAALLGAVGYTGQYFNEKSSRSLEEFYNDILQPSIWLFDSLVHARAIEGNTFALMLAADEKENAFIAANTRERRGMMDKNLDDYAKGNLSEHEKELFAKILRSIELFRENGLAAERLAAQNKNREAYEHFRSEAAGHLNDYQTLLRTLIEEKRAFAEETERRNSLDAATAFRLIVGISVAALLFAVLLGLFIASRIAGPLNRLRAGVEEFATGDLTVAFEDEGKDEIAMMGGSLASMASKLRESMRAISDAADRLGHNAEEFSALAEESNAGVEESRAGVDNVSSQMESLAAASQEINASVEEVASGAQASAQKSTEMAGEVDRARSAGEEGMSAVGKVVKSIEGVAEDSEKAAQEVRNLGERAREIQNFVDQIGGIADQTNLLALNAAIEAARAGEAGRGFAVVAEEVRKLAEESNKAAEKIADLAGGIRKDLDRVVAASEGNAKDSYQSSELARETRGTIGKMMEALSRIATATQDLAAVSEEQAASSEEIAAAVQNIASRVSTAAASSDMVRGQMSEVGTSAERVAQGSEDLAALSEELAKLVRRFRITRGENAAGGIVPLERGRK